MVLHAFCTASYFPVVLYSASLVDYFFALVLATMRRGMHRYIWGAVQELATSSTPATAREALRTLLIEKQSLEVENGHPNGSSLKEAVKRRRE